MSKLTCENESHLVIESKPGWHAIDFPELWRYRELLWFLAMRDVKVRYNQAALGALWAVIQPFSKMLVFTMFFGYLMKMPSNSISYPLFAYCGLLPWQLFAFSLTQAGNSIVTNERLITKIYFPRLLIPFSAVLVGLVDFVCAFVVYLGLMAFYGFWPSWAVLTLPLFTILAVITAMAVGLWLSALTALYQDFRYTLTFITELWFFVTPVIYPSTAIPPSLRWILALNPMTGVVEGFRWALLPGSPPPGMMLAVSMCGTILLLIGGMLYFRRMELTFADRV